MNMQGLYARGYSKEIELREQAEREKDNPSLHKFGKGGATSSHKCLPYHLISTTFQNLLAKRLSIGVPKHGAGNHLNGNADFIVDRFNHILEHWLAFRDGRIDDDEETVIAHLGAMACDLMLVVDGLHDGRVSLEDFQEGVKTFPKKYVDLTKKSPSNAEMENAMNKLMDRAHGVVNKESRAKHERPKKEVAGRRWNKKK